MPSATGAKYSSVTVTALTSGARTTNVNVPSCPGATDAWSSGVARWEAIQSAGLYMPLARSRGFAVPRLTIELLHVAVPMLRAVNDEVAVSPDSSVRYGLCVIHCAS